ncbi:type 4a pilus biogenesis protein PilO [Thermodesulfobacterium hydrogeniphilum]|uniref:type 4a pilus biogenesis protein PilO n=1 Tax=Thermodesulfobacterium hydrogeniphilum TaxID=161156 RepID=UPI000571AD4B|nr:type 4a pilus biogenesis protein PilO [Thermodesulfobacterium hydrogeniphilum]
MVLLEKIKTWEKTATTREKILTLVIVIILPLFLFLKFYYFPTKEKIAILKKDIINLNFKIKRYQNLVKKREILNKQLIQRKKFLEFVKNILPTEKEIPDLLKSLAYTAKRNNLEIISFKPVAEKFKDYYKEIPISIEFAGDFKDIINFFNDIENMARLIVLDRIEFKENNNELRVFAVFKTFQYTGKIISKKRKP